MHREYKSKHYNIFLSYWIFMFIYTVDISIIYSELASVYIYLMRYLYLPLSIGNIMQCKCHNIFYVTYYDTHCTVIC
jgi:hypothetical protein